MNSNLLSKYRTELFGISTIGILIVHANDVIHAGGGVIAELIRKLFAFGGITVYVFVFLSGIGLYFSKSSKNTPITGGIRRFYVQGFKQKYMHLFLGIT